MRPYERGVKPATLQVLGLEREDKPATFNPSCLIGRLHASANYDRFNVNARSEKLPKNHDNTFAQQEVIINI